jgi:hypothetical protein
MSRTQQEALCRRIGFEHDTVSLSDRLERRPDIKPGTKAYSDCLEFYVALFYERCRGQTDLKVSLNISKFWETMRQLIQVTIGHNDEGVGQDGHSLSSPPPSKTTFLSVDADKQKPNPAVSAIPPEPAISPTDVSTLKSTPAIVNSTLTTFTATRKSRKRRRRAGERLFPISDQTSRYYLVFVYTSLMFSEMRPYFHLTKTSCRPLFTGLLNQILAIMPTQLSLNLPLQSENTSLTPAAVMMKQMYEFLVSHPPPWDDLNNLIYEDSEVQKKLSEIRRVLKTMEILSLEGYHIGCVQQGSQWVVRTDKWSNQFPSIVGLFEWLESVDVHSLRGDHNHSPSLRMTESNDSGRTSFAPNPLKRKTQDDSRVDAANDDDLFSLSHESISRGAWKRRTR